MRGAINTPQILQLSGVGNAKEFTELGIPVVQDLPGVGEHMQDHLEVYIQHACKQPVTQQPSLKLWKRPWIGFQWLFFRRGPGQRTTSKRAGLYAATTMLRIPNLMFHFLPIAIRYDGSPPPGGEKFEHGYQVHVGPMYSDARGFGQDHVARSTRQTSAAVQLSLHQAGSSRMGRGDSGHP